MHISKYDMTTLYTLHVLLFSNCRIRYISRIVQEYSRIDQKSRAIANLFENKQIIERVLIGKMQLNKIRQILSIAMNTYFVK